MKKKDSKRTKRKLEVKASTVKALTNTKLTNVAGGLGYTVVGGRCQCADTTAGNG